MSILLEAHVSGKLKTFKDGFALTRNIPCKYLFKLKSNLTLVDAKYCTIYWI